MPIRPKAICFWTKRNSFNDDGQDYTCSSFRYAFLRLCGPAEPACPQSLKERIPDPSDAAQSVDLQREEFPKSPKDPLLSFEFQARHLNISISHSKYLTRTKMPEDEYWLVLDGNNRLANKLLANQKLSDRQASRSTLEIPACHNARVFGT